MLKNFTENGEFQAALAMIVGVIAVSLVPELEPVKEHLMEIVLIVMGALLGNGLKNR
jgi:hypothetical protein